MIRRCHGATRRMGLERIRRLIGCVKESRVLMRYRFMHPCVFQRKGCRWFSSVERRRNVSERKKKEVAFSQEYKCANCGMMLPPDYAIDHIVPIALGGHNGFRNLQALCSSCHKLKTQSDVARIRDAGVFERNRGSQPTTVTTTTTTTKQPKLNEEQNEAVSSDPNRSVRVIAGPGKYRKKNNNSSFDVKHHHRQVREKQPF